MKKSVLFIAVLALFIAVIYSQRATIAERVMTKGLEARLGADITDGFEDGLHLALCGAGGPMPHPTPQVPA